MEVMSGRPDLNLASIRGYLDRARRDGIRIVAFPEMCIAGYFLGDLWEQDTLVRDFAAASDAVREMSEELTVIFGNVAVDETRIGEDGRLRKYNAVYVCHDGRYLSRPLPEGVGTDVLDLPGGACIAPKTLHPNYRFFDDDRHFYSVRKLALETGLAIEAFMQPFEVELEGGRRFRFGVQLCEDIWHDDYRYRGDVLDTLRMWAGARAQAVFNLSSSPWTLMKNDKRHRVVTAAVARARVPFFYVNHVGAQNNGTLAGADARASTHRRAAARRHRRAPGGIPARGDPERDPASRSHPRRGQSLPGRRQRWRRFRGGARAAGAGRGPRTRCRREHAHAFQFPAHA
jgi:NAD+ synthase (glutamine-hydrolysing)